MLQIVTRLNRRRIAGACALAALFTLAQTGRVAGQAAATTPIYDVRVDLDPVSTGTTTFIVDKTGKVSGVLHVESPNVADAKLGGTVKDGVWTFEYPFEMPAQGCQGSVSGTAKVSADQKLVSGSMTIGGGCAEQPMSATFTFTQRAKK